MQRRKCQVTTRKWCRSHWIHVQNVVTSTRSGRSQVSFFPLFYFFVCSLPRLLITAHFPSSIGERKARFPLYSALCTQQFHATEAEDENLFRYYLSKRFSENWTRVDWWCGYCTTMVSTLPTNCSQEIWPHDDTVSITRRKWETEIIEIPFALVIEIMCGPLGRRGNAATEWSGCDGIFICKWF